MNDEIQFDDLEPTEEELEALEREELAAFERASLEDFAALQDDDGWEAEYNDWLDNRENIGKLSDE